MEAVGAAGDEADLVVECFVAGVGDAESDGGEVPPYSDEFKREAVKLLRTGDRTVPQLARDLAVSKGSLRSSSAQLDVDEGKAEGLSRVCPMKCVVVVIDQDSDGRAGRAGREGDPSP